MGIGQTRLYLHFALIGDGSISVAENVDRNSLLFQAISRQAGLAALRASISAFRDSGVAGSFSARSFRVDRCNGSASKPQGQGDGQRPSGDGQRTDNGQRGTAPRPATQSQIKALFAITPAGW